METLKVIADDLFKPENRDNYILHNESPITDDDFLKELITSSNDRISTTFILGRPFKDA